MSLDESVARIQGHVDDQDTLIQQIKTALQGKGSGGETEYETEQWVFTLIDDTVVTKEVIVK